MIIIQRFIGFKRFSLFLLLTWIMVPRAFSQQTPTSAGGITEGEDGSVSFSIGQVFYDWDEGSQCQGVQQPFEFWEANGIRDELLSTWQCTVFPLPAREKVWIRFHSYGKPLDAIAILRDISGKILLTNRILAELTAIPLETGYSGIILLTISDHSGLNKTFIIPTIN